MTGVSTRRSPNRGDSGAPDWFTEDETEFEAIVVYDCDRCGHWHHAIVEIAALAHPGAVGFHHEHGIDLRTTPPWDLDWIPHAQSRVAQTDPFRVALTIELDDAARTFVFDRQLRLVAEQTA